VPLTDQASQYRWLGQTAAWHSDVNLPMNCRQALPGYAKTLAMSGTAGPVGEHVEPARMSAALDDVASHAARVACCRALAVAFSEAGQLSWVGGYMIGPDRVSGASPFGFGSDEMVGLGTVVAIGAELLSGTVSLLSAGNPYAALALICQLVEVEYLARAAAWLRSTRGDRLKM